MISEFQEDTHTTVTMDPPLKRYWGLLVILIMTLMVVYNLWGQSPPEQSDTTQDRLKSTPSQAALSANSDPTKAVPNVGVAMPQDWWQSPVARSGANKRLINRLYTEVLNSRTPEVAADLFATDFSYQEPDFSADLIMYLQHIETQHRTYHKLRFIVEDMVSEGDQVVVRWLASGTPSWTFETHPPTGEPVVWRGMTIWQVNEGKIVAGWTVFGN